MNLNHHDFHKKKASATFKNPFEKFLTENKEDSLGTIADVLGVL